jgi:hypothetical protein
MVGISAPGLLALWEQGLGQHAIDRALTLLTASCPGSSPQALASLSIGRRDAGLLKLREWAFGTELAGLVLCPRCGARLELKLDLATLRSATEPPPPAPVSRTVQGVELRFRPPNTDDLRAVAGLEMDEMRSQLVERCLLQARSCGETLAMSQLRAEVVDAMIDGMAEADPHADIQVGICCAACSHQWDEVLDIVSFFWTELDAWARRVLSEVHTLALAYGWRENDILALSPARRQLYLEMVSA